jgi:hypothetical protein
MLSKRRAEEAQPCGRGSSHDRIHIHFSFDPDSPLIVRVDFLFLPGVLQGTSILKRSIPVCRETKKSLVKRKDRILK